MKRCNFCHKYIWFWQKRDSGTHLLCKYNKVYDEFKQLMKDKQLNWEKYLMEKINK